MENAADALKMAAAILIFIIAITASFSLFGTAKQTADSIIGMRDKQAYLEAAELDNGILYTSSEAITSGNISGLTQNGDRIVNIADIISTISRYSKEKYGVTIINKTNGEVIARYDSSTENFMNNWYTVTGTNDEGNKLEQSEVQAKYVESIKANLKNDYVSNISLNLEELYKIKVDGNNKIKCGAPWYGNDEQIQERIRIDLQETNEKYKYNGQTYEGKNLLSYLKGKTIVEVTNEIDRSKYLSDTNEEGNNIETNLLQQYEMPTVEIIYIILD